ncbi:peptidase family C78-domain-containing protein [Naematelia encephala]|uniref:Peptidase family C78-domain-containing protein n=1 Tax=Naematelia encephala TaxID=71784 RepID=A0A1Y2AWP3_9TREE|nr:peptidase family C78-domain-containing protein [Naematelia encephala]
MPRCPVCGERIDADTKAFNHHVNAHFDGPGPSTLRAAQVPSQQNVANTGHRSPRGRSVSAGSGTSSGKKRRIDDEMLGNGAEHEDGACPLCGFPFLSVPPEQRQSHVNACLDGDRSNIDSDDEQYLHEADGSAARAQDDRDNRVDSGWDGPANPGVGWAKWRERKVDSGDKWWDPVSDSTKPNDIPSNFSPGIIPVLRDLLLRSHSHRITREAVICSDTVHIKGIWKFDLGWGCGYRNALMAISALVLANADYRPVFSKEANGADPGVRRVQGWIEEAWHQGFDTMGRDQLKGKILGTRKWIGTSDLYAMFTSKGIPCRLFDFPKPRPGEDSRKAHVALQNWVKQYFAKDPETSIKNKKSSTSSPISAFDILMGASGGDDAVRASDKLPLILQHSGHSRSIVGYEETTSGAINLLLFDPGKSIPKDLRAAGLERLETTSTSSSRPGLLTQPDGTRTSSSQSHESINFSPPYTNGRSELIDLPSDCQTMRGGTQIRLQEDEEMDDGGWVRKKFKPKREKASATRWDTDIGKALGYFRVNVSSLGSHTQYQVLAFTGGPLLSEEERVRRKVIDSEVIR